MEFLIILLLLLLNGVFAMYEIALVSSGKARLETAAQKGSRNARRVLRQKENPEQTLSAIQVGITLIGIVSGAFGGVALSDELAPLFLQSSLLAPYAAKLSLITVVTIITYLSLVIGELVPKSLALDNPEKIAASLAPLMQFVTRASYPFVWLLSLSTRGVNRLLGVRTGEERPLTEEELKFILHESSQQGVIDREESRMIKDVFRFTDKRADELMTRRKEVVCLRNDMSRDEVLRTIESNGFGKYPLCNDTIEEATGVVPVKKLVALLREGVPFDLQSIAASPLYIPEQLHAPRILELFKAHKTNFGFVVDEYGSVEGILTIHDLTENIFGELLEEDEESEPEITRRPDGTLLVDGSMNVGDFLETMEILAYEDVEEEGFSTLGGLAMHFLRTVPKEGDTFRYRGLRFEVVDMDGSRVDKLLVSREP